MKVSKKGARSTEHLLWMHRFAVITACAAFGLIIAGGLVTSTDSGLAVPDWPLSYGQIMPPMVGGIFYEHGHRMMATFVGLLTTILAFWIWRSEERGWVKALGWVALIAVVVQGVLGGLTVLYLLPTPISVAHATLAQSFFCLTIVIALVTSPFWRQYRAGELPTIGKVRRWTVAASAAIFLQLILGALIRHTGSALAIPDFPFSYGALLPPMDAGSLSTINETRLAMDLPSVELSQVWIHFAHRIGAMLVVCIVSACVWQIFTNFKYEAKLREPALIILLLLGVQILLGALTVWTGRSVEVTTAHVAGGALLLGVSVILSVRSYQLYRLPSASVSIELVPEAGRS